MENFKTPQFCSEIKLPLGNIHVLRKQKGGREGVSQMLTFAYLGGGGGQDTCLRNHILGIYFRIYVIDVFALNKPKYPKKFSKSEKILWKFSYKSKKISYYIYHLLTSVHLDSIKYEVRGLNFQFPLENFFHCNDQKNIHKSYFHQFDSNYVLHRPRETITTTYIWLWPILSKQLLS